MSPSELARLCAKEIRDAFVRDGVAGLERAEGLVRGAILRALDDAGAADGARLVGQTGKVGVKLTQSTQGVSLEADVDRPREPGESWSYAVEEAARLAAIAYQKGAEEAAQLGLTIGKAPKPEGAR